MANELTAQSAFDCLSVGFHAPAVMHIHTAIGSVFASGAHRGFVRSLISGGAVSPWLPSLSPGTSPSRIVSSQDLAIVCPQHWGGAASVSACTTRPQELQ